MSLNIAAPHLKTPVHDPDHIIGPATAAMTLVEYGDFECPACGQAYSIVHRLLDRFTGELRFVFRNFPLATAHPHAQLAAEAAEAAGAQGEFWPMHAALYENQDALEDEDFVRYAIALGLDEVRFTADLSTGAFAQRVHDDFLSGVRSGVNGTPTFFINGDRFDRPYDYATLRNAIEDELRIVEDR